MLRLVEREMKRDSWSLFLFFVAMTKHNERKSDRFVCIDNASMCIQSSDQVSSFEIRVVKLFLDLYKQMREENLFTNPDNFFIYICFRKKNEEDTLMLKVQKLIVFYQVKVLVVDEFFLFVYQNDNDWRNYLKKLMMKEMKHSVVMMMMLQQQRQLN